MESSNLSKLTEGWTPPDGLNRSGPRPVRLAARGIFLSVVCAVLAIGGLIAAVWLTREGRRQEAEARLMAEQGKESQGEVTRLWSIGGKSDEHRVAYRFTVSDSDFAGSQDIRSGYWRSLQVGSPIPIRYLPSDPARNYPSQNPPSPTPAWLALLVGAYSIAAIGVFAFKVQRERHLLADGRPAPAVVTRLRTRRTRYGPRNIIYYEFPLYDGGTGKGRSNLRRRSVPEGSVICVLYDPDNPRRSAAYPMCLVKVAEL
jgi:hypothetical protein